jgi:serine/threonine-protein kinase RsbW
MAELNVDTELSQLASICDFVMQTGRELGLDDHVIYDLQLAVDEACANVVKHAYDGQAGEIEVKIEPVDDSVQVIIRDWGAAFDPQEVPTPDLTGSLEQRPLGGLGVYLMRQVMDEVDFRFDSENGNGNTLTMVKRLPESGY